jgi:hypothetical protein
MTKAIYWTIMGNGKAKYVKNLYSVREAKRYQSKGYEIFESRESAKEELKRLRG